MLLETYPFKVFETVFINVIQRSEYFPFVSQIYLHCSFASNVLLAGSKEILDKFYDQDCINQTTPFVTLFPFFSGVRLIHNIFCSYCKESFLWLNTCKRF